MAGLSVLSCRDDPLWGSGRSGPGWWRGVDHQRLQQFITSSTWDYPAVRRNVVRWFAARQPVEALVVDDIGFVKDGDASPCVARQYSGTLGKLGNCQIGVSVHLVNERSSCAAGWRLLCPASWG
jgi:SRSO17 transposase